MKRLLTIFLLLTGVVSAQESCLTWVTNANEIMITGYVGDPVDVNIPSTINSLPVTTIESNAFARCESLQNVVIAESVTNMGNRVFLDCVFLESIRFPASITDLRGGIVLHCFSLKTVITTAPTNELRRDQYVRSSKLIHMDLSNNVIRVQTAQTNAKWGVIYTGTNSIIIDRIRNRMSEVQE